MEEQQHAKLGIASLITSIASGILIFLLVVIAGVLQVSTPGGLGEESMEAMLIGLFLFAFLFLSLVALGLGIGGLFQKEKKKTYAILGIIFSSVTILGTVALIVLGLAMG